MKKILVSLGVIVAVGAVVIGATGAFFSDTETSVGNTFTAGDIDLQIDNESYAIDYNIPGYDNPVGDLVASTHTSWELKDLTIEKFFDFIDLKPGDMGEDTISIHVGSNDAWVCAAARITEDSDVTYTEPEEDDDPTVNLADPLGTDGELDEELNFVFWVDDGDNVLEECPKDQTNGGCIDENVFLEGTLDDMGAAGQIALADSNSSILGGTDPIPGDSTFYIGKAWCFGELTPAPVPQDGVGKTNPNTNGPLARDTGVDCDGADVDNASQTDRVVGDLQFYAEQSRNNDDFLCSRDWTPDFQVPAPQPQEEVGAVLGAYSAPSCDVTASSTIQAAIGDANPGETVCVPDGTYNETVVIGKALTLASENGPTNSSTITGGIQVDSSDVTVTGFIINPGDVPADPGNIGVFLNGSLSNIVISYNKIDGSNIGDASDRGILTVTNGNYSNVVIDNNVIHDLQTGIYINPVASGLLTITNNDIDDNVAGIGGLNGATVTNNEFESTLGVIEAIGIDSSFDGNNAVVNFNNFLNDTRLNTYGTINDPIDVTNNYWSPNGGDAQSNDNGGTNTINLAPEAGAAYPHQ